MGIQGPNTMGYSHSCNMFQPLEYVSVHMWAIAIVYSHSPPVITRGNGSSHNFNFTPMILGDAMNHPPAMTHGNFSPHKFPWMTPS